MSSTNSLAESIDESARIDDLFEGERTRVEESLIPPRVETVETVTPEHGLIFAEQLYRETADSEIFFMALSATRTRRFLMTVQAGRSLRRRHTSTT
jgi:hypothetical protein